MKAHLLLLSAALYGITASAQIHSIEPSRHMYRIEKSNVGGYVRDPSPQGEPSTYTSVTKESRELDTLSAQRQHIIDRYLSVSYPLPSIHVSSPYGKRRNPFNHQKQEMHKGVDLRAKEGTEVYAMMSGVVTKVGSDKRSGNYVTLRHGDYTVSYCHLSKQSAVKGQLVSPGDIVGYVGNTGRSTGPHLHLRLRHNGKTDINPMVMLDFIKATKEECLSALTLNTMHQSQGR